MSVDVAAALPQQTADRLAAAGLLVPLGVRGVYGFGAAFEDVIDRFDRYVTRAIPQPPPEVLRCPPLLARHVYAKTDHLETFPNLLGAVHSFFGDERQHVALAQRKAAGEDWSDALQPTEVMLAPAACYHFYPTAAGTLPAGGRTVDVRAYVFRHEPSDDPARLQAFRQREVVHVGTPESAARHREVWLRIGAELLRALGLDVQVVLAHDPFFGRGGRVMAATQREQELKHELLVAMTSEGSPSAAASTNYHLDHFGQAFAIRTADGEVAHSACIGFGLERVALALFHKHGLDVRRWPESVRAELGS
jgi:seryl-tRNA synthetase